MSTNEKPKYYKSKTVALKRLALEREQSENGNGPILANRSITTYFIAENYNHFLETIKKSPRREFYEYIPGDVPVCFFFDIEIYETSPFFGEPYSIIDICIEKVRSILPETRITKIILESHSTIKKSFHVIIRAFNENDEEVLFENVTALKKLYKRFGLEQYRDGSQYIIDPSVYREGLFRTIYSTKSNENRILQRCEYGDDFEDISTFVGYHENRHVIYKELEELHELQMEIVDGEKRDVEDGENVNGNALTLINKLSIVNVPEDLNETDIQNIKKFVQKEFHHYPNRIRDVFIDNSHNCIVVALNEKYCPFVDREHKSNNQYIVIDTSSAKQKCHDTDCREYKYIETKLENYPKEINETIKKCLKVNQQELELIDNAIIECKNYITENFDRDIKSVSFDRNAMIFRGNVEDKSLAKILKGKCPECHVEHQISDTGYCLKCKTCNSIFPKNQLIPVDSKYKHLNNFWTNYQIGTINNIINIYNNNEEDFSCDIQLDTKIIKDKKILKIVNECLDGHKITKLSELMHNIYKDYIFTGNEWYIFDGNKWSVDNKSLNFKRNILDLCNTFNKIKQFYENQNVDERSMAIIKNIKSLITKINKPQLKDDILKDAQLFYIDNKFYTKLNSKNHLVPFDNGLFDLLERKFRKTKKDDYINLVVGYPYSESTDNREVHEFLDKILPNQGIKDYVMKKLSECLNGDIPNTHFLMFIGDGANGKSQLLNLMKLAMGEFGEKVEVTLLTRKRNNANEANTEKVKLFNKRFAFLSEPEDGEKINIGLLKELTGSEEIVARGLYQDSVSFVMEAKLYLACNELPEIKGEDTALWRRIRVIDFPSRFVDDPKEANEYKIDRTLPSRMREDLSWRQTFMKILIDYYYRDVKEPHEVKVRTNEYRQDNNELFAWLDENIEYRQFSILQFKDICELISQDLHIKLNNNKKSKIKVEIQKWIKEKYPKINNAHQDTSYNNTKYKGWLHIGIKEAM